MKLAWGRDGNLYCQWSQGSNWKLVKPLLISYYVYVCMRIGLAACVARYVVWLIESCQGIPLWWFTIVGLVFAALLARLTPEALEELRQECVKRWAADAALPTHSIKAELLRALDALESSTNPKAAAPLMLPKIPTGWDRR